MFNWLNDYQKLKQNIAYLEYNLEQTEAELKRWISGDLRNVSLTQDSQGAKVEDVIENIKSELAFKQNQINKLIALVNDFEGLDNQILKFKYIYGMTLEEIAERVDYSYSHVKKRHAELIRLIRFAEKKGII
ncbi:sigma-70 family RNA polymerase sigma factor [Bacillus toyonensis]|uniref:sigma-70 family RNA polymerase sigma factor n=1 Tax=Bacillus toyonensis TaxID=155322 RepID=UPI000CD96E40|nr:sigma-70 family RNA polymerase sigma factor [Bacillus toyonensis]MED3538279.1 sigma-70 family RNA polymerase sigma factor [Bacillus toyonensis]MEE2017015.1 sigma-70 family RNA polymerase sigma factor [Bacillus toyonensis]